MSRYKPEDLRHDMEEVLTKLGTPEEDAKVVSDALLRAEMRGFGSHGILRFPKLIHNTNHFGMAGYYAEMAARRDMIGIVMCNTEPAMAPFGGETPILGTNPVSVAIPTKKHPVLLDTATTNIAKGKILKAKKEKKLLPEDCALDREGNPTINPEKVFSLLPLGGKNFGYKGYGLSFVIDILCGPLINAESGKEVKGTVTLEKCTKGDLFIVINISSFTDIDLFKSKVDHLIQDVKNDGAMFPGEIEEIKEEQNKDGIEIQDEIYNEFKEVVENLMRK